MRVRLTQGLQAGDVIEVEDEVGQAYLASGQAVEPEVEVAEVADTPETPEDPKKSSAAAGKKRSSAAAEKPETR